MFGIENLALFAASGILLNMTPGQDTMYILTRSIAQGRGAGVFSVLGISTGLAVHTCAAGLGLSAVLAASPSLFLAVKLLGAAYLIYLGWRMLRTPLDVRRRSGSREANGSRLARVYAQGVLTNVLNPKVALFFLAFMPQFISPQSSQHTLAFLLLGGVFITTGTLWCLVLSFFASGLGRVLYRRRYLADRMNSFAGGVLIALGLKLGSSAWQ
jgi:threonine/homoserine/homoserine lactone efflux protein